MQTTYGNTMPAYVEGQFAQQRDTADVQSRIVKELLGIVPGRWCAVNAANTEARYLTSNQADLTLSADLGASNVLAGNLIVNGVTYAYTETYATSHIATMTILLGELNTALTGIAVATLVADDAGTANRRIRIVPSAVNVDAYFATGAVTGGSAVTVTLANGDSSVPYGVSMLEAQETNIDGTFANNYNLAIGLGRSVYVAMRSDAILNYGAPVYARFFEESSASKKRGMLTNAAASGGRTVGVLLTNVSVAVPFTAGGIGVLRINFP